MDVLNELIALLDEPRINTDDEPSATIDCAWLWAQADNHAAMPEPIHSGKWMLFAAPDDIDALWQRVKVMVQKGVVWRWAKVSTAYKTASSRHHVICIYTYNWKDLNDIYNTRAKIGNALCITRPIAYKSDEMTLRGEKGSLYYF